MTIYFALLRGINVSGHNMIKMTELKRMFEEMGFTRVQTYINSGNVIFESEERAELLEARIETEISSVFGFHDLCYGEIKHGMERDYGEVPVFTGLFS